MVARILITAERVGRSAGQPAWQYAASNTRRELTSDKVEDEDQDPSFFSDLYVHDVTCALLHIYEHMPIIHIT